LLNVVPADRFT